MQKCSICNEAFNLRARTKVKCASCEHIVCRTCLSNWLREGPPQNPSCMECKRPYKPMELAVYLPQSWMKNEYRQAVGRWLTHTSKAWEVEANAFATTEKKIKKLKDTLLDEYNKIRKIKENIRNITDEVEYLKKTMNDKISAIKCPMENCDGWVITGEICPTCDTKHCERCGEGAPDGHVCNPDIISNLDMVKRVSKPCPRCSIPIQRTEGCNQMWCTNCNGAFNWHTLVPISNLSNFFNPHMNPNRVQDPVRNERVSVDTIEMATRQLYRTSISKEVSSQEIEYKLTQFYLKQLYEQDLSAIASQWSGDSENPEAIQALALLRNAYGKSKIAMIH